MSRLVWRSAWLTRSPNKWQQEAWTESKLSLYRDHLYGFWNVFKSPNSYERNRNLVTSVRSTDPVGSALVSDHSIEKVLSPPTVVGSKVRVKEAMARRRPRRGKVRRRCHPPPFLFPRCKDDFMAETSQFTSFSISTRLHHFTTRFVFFFFVGRYVTYLPPPQSYSALRGVITL